MVASAVNINTGTTILFGTSGFTAELTSIQIPSYSRKAIPTSHLGTAAPTAGQQGNASFIPGDIIEGKEFTIAGSYNGDAPSPIDEATELVTITLKEGGKWAGQGFLTAFDKDIGGDVDTKMTFTATIQPTGPWTPTAAP